MVKSEVKTEKLDDITIKDHEHRRRVVSSAEALDRKFKRTVLCVAKPSYLLSLLERSSTRCNYLKRLPKILSELLRQRNWREASGVLSVLMQGTMGDGSPSMNRLTYEVLELAGNAARDNKKTRCHVISSWL
ncbi:BnaA09g40580D [Brassica napus]|uniref:BnaA09g40580D protein n=1 Tax=Brassica napus TaxID=3708 RepID=A0A078FES1_BRANA|nr:BnaA09g40580D [Brassica napus]